MKNEKNRPKLDKNGTDSFHVNHIGFNQLSSTSLVVLVFLILILLAGCKMSDPMIEKIIQEMDSVYFKNRNDDDVDKVVQQYFVVGTDFDEYLPLLNKFNDDKFKIREYRHGIIRIWPNGEFSSPYRELTKLSLERRYPEGTKGFVIKKRYYGNWMIIVEKIAVIILRVDVNGKLYEVSGRIHINSI